MKRAWLTFARLWPVWIMLAALPLLIPAAAGIRTNTDDIIQWLPDGASERKDYDRFVELFGADQVVVVSWPGATLQDDRLGKLAAALVEHDDAGAPLIARVKTGPEMMRRLTGEPLHLSQAEARERLQGLFVARFGAATAMVIELTDIGRDKQQAVIDHVVATAAGACDLPRDELRLGGNAYEAVSVDQASSARAKQFCVLSMAIGVVMALVCFRDVRLTLITLAVAVFSELLVVGIIYYIGGSLNAVSIIVPTLVYVLTVSGAVHLINYYRDAVGEHGSDGAVRRMLGAGWLPCLTAAGSTAIGMISLSVSQIEPVRSFGLYSAVGLTASVLVLLTMLPALLHAWPGRAIDAPSRRAKKPSPSATTWVDPLCHWILRRHAWVSVLSMLVIGGIGLGMLHTTTSVKITRMFGGESELIRNYTWLEANVGPLNAIETLVAFDDDCSLSALERTELIAEIQSAIGEEPDVGGTFSAATFAPAIPPAGNAQADAARQALDALLEKQHGQLQAQHVLATEDDNQLWRITARIPALHEMDYGEFANRIRGRVDPLVQARREDGLTGVEVSYTGMSPLINKATGQLLDDLSHSFVLALLLICPVMMVMLRGFFPGLLSMIPNVIPAAMVFGTLGWLGQPLDIGAVLTASVALGIAVDDTFHFLTWFQRGVRGGLSRRDAVADAYRRCATAMVQTTIICGGGLMVYFFSEFVPTSRFAILMGGLLLAALVADLLLLPALLAGPVGALFASSKPRAKESPLEPCLTPAYLPVRPGLPAWAISCAAALALMVLCAALQPGCLSEVGGGVEVNDNTAEEAPVNMEEDVEEFAHRRERILEESPREEGAAPQPSLAPTRLNLANVAEVAGQFGDGTASYRCTIYLDADAQTLRQVKSITYFLHPTFQPNRHTTTRRADAGFPIVLELWGEFEMRAIVTMQDGSQRELRHWIELS